VIFRRLGPAKRRPPKIKGNEIIMGLVFHCLQGAGTLAENIKLCTGKVISEAAVSERRLHLPWTVFLAIMGAALRPKAQEVRHGSAFYQGRRLVALDGTQFSVSNTPQILSTLSKAASRRMRAAFAKVGLCLLVEVGIHNPIAAAIARAGESEMALAKKLLQSLPEKCLLLADRLYGVGAFVGLLLQQFKERRGDFWVRVRSNLKPRVLQVYQDGSALIEVKVPKMGKVLVREVRGRVRRPHGKWSEVRLWTTLGDWKQSPARELLALYGRRWEQELIYKELKIDMRQAQLLRSHTAETAAQEIAALVWAYAVVAEERMKAAQCGQQEVLRISFGKTLVMVRAFWLVVEASEGLLDQVQIESMTRKVLGLIARQALRPRRKRSCPRAVRQPVGSWPRLTTNTYEIGETQYEVTPIVK
jgi:hypothetical protein